MPMRVIPGYSNKEKNSFYNLAIVPHSMIDPTNYFTISTNGIFLYYSRCDAFLRKGVRICPFG